MIWAWLLLKRVLRSRCGCEYLLCTVVRGRLGRVLGGETGKGGELAG